MRRDLQTFCPKDCRYNSGSFCLLPFDSTCPHCTYSSSTSLFGHTRFVATPYGKCPVCGAEGPCDVLAGEPTSQLSATGVEYLFRCPKCHEVSWVRADRYEYTMEPVSIPDDVNMVDDEKPTKTGTTCIICGEKYEIEDPNDGHICAKCKSAIKRLREIFEDVDANSEEMDSSEDTEDGVTTVGATTDEPMTLTLHGELHGLHGDTDGDVTWFIGQIHDESEDDEEECRERCEEPDDETDTDSEREKLDDEDDVYPMECTLCDLYGKKPCVPNAGGENFRCSHCTKSRCARLEEEYDKLTDEDKEDKEEVTRSKEPAMTVKDFVARFLVEGMRVEIICDDYIDIPNSSVVLQTLGQYVVEDCALCECPEALLAANVLVICSSEYSDGADIAIYIDRIDGKKTEIRH